MDERQVSRALLSGHRAVVASAARAAATETARHLRAVTAGASGPPVAGPTAPPLLRTLWQLLSQSSASADPVCTAIAAATIVSLVRERVLPPQPVLDAMLSVASEHNLAHVASAVASLIRIALSADSRASVSLSRDLRHPFCVLVDAFPSEWDAMLELLYEFIIDEDVAALNAMQPFILLTLTIGTDVGKQTDARKMDLAKKLLESVASKSPEYSNAASHIMLHALEVAIAGEGSACLSSLSMIDELRYLAARSILPQQICDRLLTIVLELACDLRNKNASVLRALSYVPTLVTPKTPPWLIFASLLVLLQLLQSPLDSDREPKLLLRMIRSTIRILQQIPCTALVRNVVACSIFPLVALEAEIPDKSISENSGEIRDLILEILGSVDSILSYNSLDSGVTPEELTAVLGGLTQCLSNSSGPLSATLTSLAKFCECWNGRSIAEKFFSDSWGFSSTPMMLTAFLFHPVESVNLEAICRLEYFISTPTLPQSSAREEKLAAGVSQSAVTAQSLQSMRLLPVLLRVFNTPMAPSTVKSWILNSTIPALVTSHSDSFVTTNVMRIITSFLSPLLTATSSSTAVTQPVLCAVGIRMLLAVWKVQPRIWPQLKGVLSAWVNRKRARSIALKRMNKKNDILAENELDLEVAVGLTICEVCRLKAKSYGQDMLPLALAILELAIDTLISTKVFALEAVNLCISADITDPRAVWNVHHCTFVKTLGEQAFVHEEIWIKIFEYYSLTDSELYLDFKTEILTKHLLPLLRITSAAGILDTEEPKHTEAIRSAAYKACASFEAPDLYGHFPEPMEFMSSVVNESRSWTNYQAGPSHLVTSLVLHEVQNMRRAVFKAIATDVGVGKHALTNSLEASDEDKELGRCAKVLKDIGIDIRSRWGSGKAPAALRSGFAAASLCIPYDLLSEEAKGGTFEFPSASISRVPLYKDFVNGLRDLNFTDHLLVRAEVLETWTAFWTSRLLGVLAPNASAADEDESTRRARGEWVFRAALGEIETRLEAAKQPGLIAAAASIELSGASDDASRTIRNLSTNYARNSDNVSEFLKSDEVQFAVCASLAHLSQLLFPTDEESFSTVLAHLIGETSADDESSSAFGAGYGLSIVLRELLQSPMPIISLIQSLVSFVTTSLRDQKLSSNALIGLGFGLSSFFRLLTDVSVVELDAFSGMVQQCAQRFAEFASNDAEMSKRDFALAISDCWVVAGAAAWGFIDDVEEIQAGFEIIISRFEASVSRLFSLRHLFQILTIQLGHADVLCHARIAMNRLLVASGKESSVSDSLIKTADSISKPNQAVSIKIGLALSLIPLVEAANVALLRRAMETMASLLFSQDPKVSRIVGWVVGKGFSAFTNKSSARLDEHSGGGGEAKSLLNNRSRQKDPADYRRLNESSSFLRAAFDTLSKLAHEDCSGGLVHAAKSIFLGLLAVDAGKPPDVPRLGLPLVSWTRVLGTCRTWAEQVGDKEFRGACFQFAAVFSSHTSAKSLVDAFVADMQNSVVPDARGLYELWDAFPVCGPNGVGKLLTLAGLVEYQSKEDAVMTVAPSKVLEILQSVISFVYCGDGKNFPGSQIELAETIFHHLKLQQEHLPESVKKLKSELVATMCRSFESLPDEPTSENDVAALRWTVRTALCVQTAESESLMELLLQPDFWNPKFIWALLCLMEFSQEEASLDWMSSYVTTRHVNNDLLYVRILQHVFSHEARSAGPYSCVNACASYLSHVVQKRVKSVGSTDPVSDAIFKMTWIVRYLDVMIIACSSKNGAGIDFCLSKGLAGALALLDAHSLVHVSKQSGIVSLPEDAWNEFYDHSVMNLVRLLDLPGTSVLENVQKQVKSLFVVFFCLTLWFTNEILNFFFDNQAVKRLQQLLGDTVSPAVSPSGPSKVVVSMRTRRWLVNVLLRMRRKSDDVTAMLRTVALSEVSLGR
ncbi:hypothetical protein HDU84_002975 [Entophlyctis sp. JEL0112]|nr:hypothetical protein HDU84_002975 [Entophlyctis sp. JEL0112]